MLWTTELSINSTPECRIGAGIVGGVDVGIAGILAAMNSNKMFLNGDENK